MKGSKIFAFIIALVIILRTTLLSEQVSSLYYAILVLGFVITIARKLLYFKWEIDARTLIFLFVCLISILFNDIDPRYRTWEKFMGFTMLLVLLGPFDKSEYSLKLKFKVMSYLEKMIILFAVISFFMYLLRLPIGFVKGSFNGLSLHSMTMSPLAAIGSIFCLNRYFFVPNTLKRFAYLFLSVLCAFVAFLAASRGAIGGLLVGIFTLLFFKYHKRNLKLFKYIFISVIFAGAIIIYNPQGMLDNVYSKMEKRGSDNFTSGRDRMWEDRIVDFKSSPLVGVGFSSMKTVLNSKIDLDAGTQESGSGWLMLLSSTGLLGLIAFLLLLIPPLVTIWNHYPQYAFYASLAVFFSIHTIIEGYTIAFGNPLAVMMWLNIGIMNSNAVLKNKYLS